MFAGSDTAIARKSETTNCRFETGGTLLDKCSQRYLQGLREERKRARGRERFGACH
jgi:hypothetical protein